MHQWDVFELTYQGKADGNPFVDNTIYAEFSNVQEVKKVSGFYDGDGTYKVRFMPSFEGAYSYRVYGTFSECEYCGEFYVEKPASHGMVHADGCHFQYTDGTPYYSIGTTCYGWTGQCASLQEQTIETLKNTSFNKVRFCIFPKHYDYNYKDPILFPYEGAAVDNSQINKYNFEQYTPESSGNTWDFSRFNAAYFQMIEQNIQKLMELGIEADLILMHPYDRWGFSKMPGWANDLYLKYVAARFSAYRNVWWSLANEYDLCSYKSMEEWEHYADVLTSHDPYSHLTSIHNCMKFYDFTKPWITHCSIQRQAGENELDNIPHWLKLYHKPIVIDEMCYEGDIEQYWGNISAEEMLRRMWKVVILGAYPGHSECYFGDNIWWSHGGRLYGESYKRFGFLHRIMEECGRLQPVGYTSAANKDGSIVLYYFGEHRPSFYTLKLGDGQYKIEVIDTWDMTVSEAGYFSGAVQIALPGKEYTAMRLTKIKGREA